jgi:hypothetical protein
MIRSVKDLSPHQRLAIESLLGHPVSEEEQVSVRAIPALLASARPGDTRQDAGEDGIASVAPDQAGDEIADDERESRPIWEVIADNMKDVPPDVMAAMPRDGASQHDHYIYGWPKREV